MDPNGSEHQIVCKMAQMSICVPDWEMLEDVPDWDIPTASAGCISAPQAEWSDCDEDADPELKPIELLTCVPSKVGWSCDVDGCQTKCMKPNSTMLIHPRFLNNWFRFAITAVALRDFEVALGSHQEGVDETPKRR